MNGRTAIVTAIAVTVIGSLYLFYTPSSSGFSMSKTSPAPSSGVPGLEFKLSQISKSPPSLLVTLKNSHPSSTYTILKWGTPLDVQATNLGVFRLIDAESGKEVEPFILKIARKMPPSPEDLQEIAPGTEHATEVVFDKPWMPTGPAKYRVQASGEFHGVWDKSSSAIKTHELDNYTSSPFDGKSFASDETLLTVE